MIGFDDPREVGTETIRTSQWKSDISGQCWAPQANPSGSCP